MIDREAAPDRPAMNPEGLGVANRPGWGVWHRNERLFPSPVQWALFISAAGSPPRDMVGWLHDYSLALSVEPLMHFVRSKHSSRWWPHGFPPTRE